MILKIFFFKIINYKIIVNFLLFFEFKTILILFEINKKKLIYKMKILIFKKNRLNFI